MNLHFEVNLNGETEPRVAIQKLQEKVPKVYFEENFSLDDPLIFYQTCKLEQSPILEQEKVHPLSSVSSLLIDITWSSQCT